MKFLTDYLVGEPWHRRAQRERQARAAFKPTRRNRKPQPAPKGWEPPF